MRVTRMGLSPLRSNIPTGALRVMRKEPGGGDGK